jgi:glycosyltransferase involved in cell wall biosynthesis
MLYMKTDCYEFDISIVLLAYQQGQLIQRAVDSILSQQINASVEIVISDDASTDETQSVLRYSEQKLSDFYPTTLILRTSNIGPSLNLSETLRLCKGRFTAYLEGDDYWVDPNHVQKCYDEITKSVEVSAVTAGYKRIDVSSGHVLDEYKCVTTTQFTSVTDLGYFPLFGASMWKSNLLLHIPIGLSSHLIDTILWHYLFRIGKCISLPYIALCYVITGTGIHTGFSLEKCLRSHVDRYEVLSKFDDSDEVWSCLGFWLWWTVEQACERNDVDTIKEYSRRLVRHYISKKPVQLTRVTKYWIISNFPKVLIYYKVVKHWTGLRFGK